MEVENYFFIELCHSSKTSLIHGESKLIKGNNKVLRFRYGDLCPVCIENNQDRVVVTVGHPSFNGNINNKSFILSYLKNTQLKADEYIANIDGEFLIIDFNKLTDDITIINSRFSSPQVFYALIDSRFILSTAYSILFKYLFNNGLSSIFTEKIYEVLLFRRLFGEGTYDNKSKYLQSASKLVLGEKLNLKRYWSPKFSRNNRSLNYNAKTLNKLIDESIDYKTSDNKKYGIMQSGGLDTRFILSRFEESPDAFNITYTKNREYKIAKKLVDYKKGSFTWIQANAGQYEKYFDYGSKITGGMFQNSALFYGHRDIIANNCDVLFSGYGMDYFFQGMYLPSKMYHLFGELVPYYKTLAKINTDIASYFINTISYKTKGFNLSDIMTKNQRVSMQDSIHDSITAQANEAKKYSDNLYDIYEYMSLGDLSRHYTYTGQLALMELTEYRTISYTNKILNFYYDLPLKHRFDARVLRRALLFSDKRFYEMPSANHGHCAGYSSFRLGMAHIYKHLPERIGIKERKRKFERTWMTAEDILKSELLNRVHKLKHSEVISSLNIIDMDKLRHLITRWDDNKIAGNQSLMMLLAVESFFNQQV